MINYRFRLLTVVVSMTLNLTFLCAGAQSPYTGFTRTVQSLYRLGSLQEINDRWNELVATKQVPLVGEDSVAFLYRGEARKVVWMGDFNGWGSSKTFDNKGKRIPQTDIWILKASLPKDARVDYRILVNDLQWMLDPVNPSHQWSGVGGGSLNSELRMPEWKEDTLTSRMFDGVPSGNIESDLLFNSGFLGYQVTYSVYTPHNYEQGKRYPVIYVTDGYEYMHERMGNMVTVLNNLIHMGKMQPVIAVFIDHRDPINRSSNRRMQELPMNEKYLNFVTRELIPVVEKQFPVSTDRANRAVIGTSVGGLSAIWFAYMHPELFGMAGIQSPAFWFKPEIYALCDRSQTAPVKIFMTTGLIHDANDSVRKMLGVLDKKGCPYQFKTVNQGQSWGNWRDLLDDMLIYLFPA